jgi:Putative transposase.
VRDRCPQCGSKRYKKSGPIHSGKQHHPCQACARQLVLCADHDLISDEHRALVRQGRDRGDRRPLKIAAIPGHHLSAAHRFCGTRDYRVLKERCVNEHGFSLHAEVRCALNQHHTLEHLCRYITRPRPGQLTAQTHSYRCCRVATHKPQRRYHPHRDVTPGIDAATRRARPASKAPSPSLPWRARAQRQAALGNHSGQLGQRQ